MNESRERIHRTLAEYLCHHVDKRLNNWDKYLPYTLFDYNSTENSSTCFEYSGANHSVP